MYVLESERVENLLVVVVITFLPYYCPHSTSGCLPVDGTRK